MENCHSKLFNTDLKYNAAIGHCESLVNTKIYNSPKKPSENKQNIGFGAEIPTTKPIEAVTMFTAATCAEVFDVEVPLDVPELHIASREEEDNYGKRLDEGNEVCSSNEINEHEGKISSVQPPNEDNSQESSTMADEDENDDDDPDNSDMESTSDSDFSDMTEGSESSGQEWKPMTKPINWVQKQIHSGANPRELLSQMLPNSGQLAPGLNDMTLWRILASMLSEPPRRQKLRYINTFADVIQLVRESKNIIVLTGAGVSVSCGIPDFRSSDGIYSRLAKDFPDLPDPQAMFDINYFSRDPRPFYKFAREIYPGQFKPSPCHRLIKLLETKQKLLRNYTQNIDTLEQVAGINNVIECHGSFSTASCTKCKFKTIADAIREDIFAQRIPVCPHCQPNVRQSSCASESVSEMELKKIVEDGIMKPDIVFFGEGLPEKFHTVMAEDKDKCDLLIVIGSSLKVRPVALIPSSIPAHVPQVLINREQLPHLEFDVELLGDSDVIINQLCHHLGGDWKQICFDEKVLRESNELLSSLEVRSCTEEEDAQQHYRLDNDSQSVKSNASASTDIALRSAGGYSDSGFESFTSSVAAGSQVVLPTSINSDTEGEASEATKTNETSILMLSDSKSKSNDNSDLLSPLPLEDNMDVVGFENAATINFQPFQPTTTTSPNSYRHLSIDSSKDSGIQVCNESSNSAMTTTYSLLPPSTQFSDSGGDGGGGTINPQVLREPVSVRPFTPTQNLPTGTEEDSPVNIVTAGFHHERKIKRRPQKRLSAADRLIEGTYYSHEISSSYVFPGAQVSWCGVSDEDGDIDEEIEDVVAFEDEDEEVEEEVLQAISPLLPPAIEAEMVTEMMAASHVERAISGAVAAKRHRTDVNCCDNEENMQKNDRRDLMMVSSNAAATIALCTTTTTTTGPPPVKRPCNNSSKEEYGENQTLMTTKIHNTSANSAHIASQVANVKGPLKGSTATTTAAPKTQAQEVWLQ